MTGLQAYRIACEVCGKYGIDNSVEFNEFKIAQTIRIGWGTWEKFGLDERKEEWRQKAFVDAWNELEYLKCMDGYLPGKLEKNWVKEFLVNKIHYSGALIESKKIKPKLLEFKLECEKSLDKLIEKGNL